MRPAMGAVMRLKAHLRAAPASTSPSPTAHRPFGTGGPAPPVRRPSRFAITLARPATSKRSRSSSALLEQRASRASCPSRLGALGLERPRIDLGQAAGLAATCCALLEQHAQELAAHAAAHRDGLAGHHGPDTHLGHPDVGDLDGATCTGMGRSAAAAPPPSPVAALAGGPATPSEHGGAGDRRDHRRPPRGGGARPPGQGDEAAKTHQPRAAQPRPELRALAFPSLRTSASASLAPPRLPSVS